MDEMMRVLVAEGDRSTRESFCAMLMRRGLVVDAAADGSAALQAIETLLPDAVALSLVLPQRDGFGVLEALSARPLRRYPYIAVVTALGADARERAVSLGADAVLLKPVGPDTLMATLLDETAGPSVLALRHAEGRVEMAKSQLTEMGMPESLKGFQYLAEAVALVSADDRLLRQATGKLYPLIAAHCGVTDHSVERAIRHAIEATWTRGSVLAIHRIFGNSIDPQRGKPTNTECVAMLAEQLRERMTLERVSK